eukprot:13300473-Alexandrium_andersonii.AAC.1
MARSEWRLSAAALCLMTPPQAAFRPFRRRRSNAVRLPPQWPRTGWPPSGSLLRERWARKRSGASGWPSRWSCSGRS